MLTTNAITYLFIYGAVLVLSYIVVRRGWLRAYPVFLAGFVTNAMVLFFFSLERGTTMLHALLVCLIWAGAFGGASVIMAAFYRRMSLEPSREAATQAAVAGVHTS